MKNTQDYIDSTVSEGRRMLKPDWNMFDSKNTDQGKSKQPPALTFAASSNTYIELVPPDVSKLPKKSFYDCAENRMSIRKYSSSPLTQNELSFLLWETAKIKRQIKDWSRRPIPSAGGRHCLKTYLYIDRVEDIPKGIYVYLPDEHGLRLVSDEQGIKDKLCKALYNQDFYSAVIFLWSAVPYVMEYRYNTVAHKMIAFEAGHICQNLHLAAETIDCGCCAISAYFQTDVDEIVKVDGEEEFILYVATIGKKQQ